MPLNYVVRYEIGRNSSSLAAGKFQAYHPLGTTVLLNKSLLSTPLFSRTTHCSIKRHTECSQLALDTSARFIHVMSLQEGIHVANRLIWHAIEVHFTDLAHPGRCVICLADSVQVSLKSEGRAYYSIVTAGVSDLDC
jgi:hypothetical protein